MLASFLASVVISAQICLTFSFVETEFNQGWQTYFDNENSEVQDIALSWQTNTTIPSYLYGTFMKNGPAQKSFGGDDPYRYYGQYGDGWAKLHKITFNGDQVTYSRRMLESANYLKCKAANKIVPTITFGPVRPYDWSTSELTAAFLNGNVNPNVAFHKLGPVGDPNGVYMSTTDIVSVIQIDPHSLKAVRELDHAETSFGFLPLTSSAHWRREVGTDNSLNFYISLDGMNYKFHLLRYGNSWQEREEIAKFKIPFLSLIHQFSNTPKYAVIAFYPVTIDVVDMLTNKLHPIDAIRRVDNAPTTFYLVDLSNGEVIDGFESWNEDIVYATHHANAFEENGEIVLDVSCNPYDALKTALDVDTVLNWNETGVTTSPSHMKRIRLNLETKEVKVEEWENKLDTPFINTFDFPIINPDFTGVKHRYVYGYAQVDYFYQHLVKKDLEDSSNDLTWYSKSQYPHEPIFIPNPDGEREDDGVIITTVFDGITEKTYVILLDAITFTEINRLNLPNRIPFPLHGQWFPNLV